MMGGPDNLLSGKMAYIFGGFLWLRFVPLPGQYRHACHCRATQSMCTILHYALVSRGRPLRNSFQVASRRLATILAVVERSDITGIRFSLRPTPAGVAQFGVCSGEMGNKNSQAHRLHMRTLDLLRAQHSCFALRVRQIDNPTVSP
jgi:hypothetical protein